MYTVPLQDIRFVLQELAGLPEVLALPGFDDFTPDLVDAVLTENARFMQEVIAPLHRVGDAQGAQWHQGQVTTPSGYREAFRQFVAAGWQGIPHPTALGGQGLPHLLAAPCSENLNAAAMAFALCALLSDGVVDALLTAGSAEQQEQLIPRLLRGEITGTMNLTEPQAGSDLARIRTRAEPQSDGTYRLFGQKIFITYGEHDLADNILHLVLARTPDAPPGIRGISLFIVPKFLMDGDGRPTQRNDVYCASLEHKLGIHGSPTAVLLYGDDQGEVGPGAIGYRVGEENHGLQYMFVMMNAARYSVGLQGIALSERACQAARRFAQERVQGRALGSSNEADTIDRHPDVQRMLLTMCALTEGGRALAYVAAADADRATYHPDAGLRAEAKARYEYCVPIIKGFCTESALEVTSTAIQVHGGMGFIEETGVAQLYRDARILPIYEGTTAIQANDLLGRKTLRDGGAVALSFLPAMRSTIRALQHAGRADFSGIATQLAGSCDDLEQAIHHLVTSAEADPKAAYAASVPYLMLAGVVHAGWHMARAALVCGDASEDAFRRHKLRVARFYAHHILPRSAVLRSIIESGSESVEPLDPL